MRALGQLRPRLEHQLGWLGGRTRVGEVRRERRALFFVLYALFVLLFFFVHRGRRRREHKVEYTLGNLDLDPWAEGHDAVHTDPHIVYKGAIAAEHFEHELALQFRRVGGWRRDGAAQHLRRVKDARMHPRDRLEWAEIHVDVARHAPRRADGRRRWSLWSPADRDGQRLDIVRKAGELELGVRADRPVLRRQGRRRRR